MALSMVIQRWCQQISSWRRAAATIRFPNATVRTQRTLHHHNVSGLAPKADKTTNSNKNRLLNI